MISILRDGTGFVPHGRLGDRGRRRGAASCSTPGSRTQVTERFAAARRAPSRVAPWLAARVDYLLIGGGLAAANCARWLREEGADGSILLVGREPDPPYNRPPLSKGYLQGKESREDVLFRPDEWWERAGRSSC